MLTVKYWLLQALNYSLVFLFGWTRNVSFYVRSTITNIKVKKFEPDPSDIIIATYPKSGTTWMQAILHQLTTDGNLDNIEHIMRFSPYLEEELDRVEKMGPGRIIKTHLTPEKMTIMPNTKYIYVQRDGLDSAIAYFEHHKLVSKYQGSFDDFFKKYINGDVPYGSWFEHVLKWSELKDHDNCLFIDFEDLKKNPRQEIEKIANFLGLSLSENELARVLERSSFEYMKRHEDKFCAVKYFVSQRFGTGSFINKGVVGRGKLISDKQKEQFLKEAKKLNLS
ncbi:hypothetical protein CWB99_21590 [Pseudoalteromonas rubra]|uniref:Sulfotransferase domain-containing protein n=1 Tax=Pseudoalteromonas rubra TaxID=43658 RepID=A0A5S3WGU4_9GAMM|nr:sulfotransferase domain-containing protein [Pseudoalteromonas rubra]TMP24608.1 hypothetical protein CWB99_21590 [Pseudoalteromonas rubra]TMP36319.1 hypothetical protein CWC00_02435 [Pseudoalteromonas rubra]